MSGESTKPSVPGKRPLRWLLRAASWAPVLAVGAFAIVLISRWASITYGLIWDADAAAAPLIAEQFGRPGTGVITIVHFGWYSMLWLMAATRDLSGYRDLWQVLPYGLVIASLSALALAVRQVRGGWAGAIFLGASIAIGPLALRSLITPNFHTTTLINVALLGAALPVLSSDAGGYARRAAVALPIALLTGLDVASDPLLLVAGVIPFAIAVAYGAVRFRNAVAPVPMVAVVAICTIAAIALPVALLIGVDAASQPLLWIVGVVLFILAIAYAAVRFRNVTAPVLVVGIPTIWTIAAVDKMVRDAMDARHISIISQPIPLTSLGHVPQNLLRLADEVALVFGSDLFGTGFEGSTLRNVVLGVLVFVIFGCLVGLLLRELWPGRVRRLGHAEQVLLIYAGGTVLAISGAFALTGLGETAGPGGLNYFLGLAVAIPLFAALVPRGHVDRAVIGCALAIVMAFNATGVESGYATIKDGSVEAYAPQIVSALEQEHLRYGYASYWDALPLTLYSRGSLEVAPVSQCRPPQPTLCAFQLNSVAAWYRDHPGAPSFVIVDPETLFVTVAPPGNGPWSEIVLIGPLQLYISPGDVAPQIVDRPKS